MTTRRKKCKRGKILNKRTKRCRKKSKIKRKSKKRKSRKRKYKVMSLSQAASKNIAKNMKGTIDQRIRRVRKLNIPERSKKDIIRELEHLRTWNTWRSQPDTDSDDE